MRPSIFSVAATVAVVCSVVLAPAAEAGRRPISRTADTTKYNPATSTTTDFVSWRVWVPGMWSVDTTVDTLSLTRKGDNVKLTVKHVKSETCQYQSVRQNLLSLWGKDATQQQMQMQPVIMGTSKYRGLSWMEPGQNGRSMHWCLPIDGRMSVLISAPQKETKLVDFIKGNFILQFATRRGR